MGGVTFSITKYVVLFGVDISVRESKLMMRTDARFSFGTSNPSITSLPLIIYHDDY